MAIERPPPDYVETRIIHAIDTSREYTDAAIRQLRSEWRKDLADLESRVKVDTAAILTAVQERPQVPGWLAGLTPGRAASIVMILGGLVSSIAGIAAATVPIIAAVQGVYLPVREVPPPAPITVPEDAP